MAMMAPTSGLSRAAAMSPAMVSLPTSLRPRNGIVIAAPLKIVGGSAVLFLVAIVLSFAGLASAQDEPAPDDIARRTFEAGRAAFAAGDFRNSMPRFAPEARTTGAQRAPARAMLKAAGFTDADLKKPLVGVANSRLMGGSWTFRDGIGGQYLFTASLRGEQVFASPLFLEAG